MNPNEIIVSIEPPACPATAEDVEHGQVFVSKTGNVFLRGWDSIINLHTHRVWMRSMMDHNTFDGVEVATVVGTLKVSRN